MLSILAEIFYADRAVYTVSLVLVITATILMSERFEHPTTAIAFAPGLLFGALTAAYISEQLGLVLSADKFANITVATAVGMMVALIVMLLSLRLIMAASGWWIQAASRRMSKRVAGN